MTTIYDVLYMCSKGLRLHKGRRRRPSTRRAPSGAHSEALSPTLRIVKDRIHATGATITSTMVMVALTAISRSRPRTPMRNGVYMELPHHRKVRFRFSLEYKHGYSTIFSDCQFSHMCNDKFINS